MLYRIEEESVLWLSEKASRLVTRWSEEWDADLRGLGRMNADSSSRYEGMISTVAEFSEHLSKLDPSEDDFDLLVDELVEATSNDVQRVAYQIVLQFFEAHPEEYCGMPGTLVHMLEGFYPNYVDELIESVGRMPSLNTLLMINRILNSELEDDLRWRSIECLKSVVEQSAISPIIRQEAEGYLQRHA